MKKEEVKSELISKMEIKVEDSLFYMPGETVKGKIILNPKYKMRDKIFHITLKLIQYEFWEYNNNQIEEIKVDNSLFYMPGETVKGKILNIK